ncbi:hypothetical protein SCOR_27445 [Sulfidibacter corallicola]|uniref:Uncharacterized protein n=1 Tax=Sulfidibacter corallicola TaxID=2818388 RepID=A0A8A4TL29_SULCO|nr:hypothetical protein [Sulfidibacter corallicola]QTD50709.1 hypothetical protein J3U87_34415 [Sulfidibacter corallicola]
MGKLRLVPKTTEPGFIKVALPLEHEPKPEKNRESHLSIRTRRGTVVHVERTMPLKQIARLIRMLENGHGLG